MSHVALRSPSPSILDLIACAEADPQSDEAHFLGQLRVAIAGLEGLAVPFGIRVRSPRPELRVVRAAE